MMSAFSFDLSLSILVAIKLVKFEKRQKQLVHRGGTASIRKLYLNQQI